MDPISTGKITLVCGYRRTGKDTFFIKISSSPGNKLETLFKWRVFALNPSHIKFDEFNSVRTAFADSLKEEASEEYNIPLVVPDVDKDIKQFVHYKSEATVSARDIYLEWGAIRRTQDPDYWCKAAFKKVSLNEKINCVVTDWRYRNEATHVLNNYQNVTTVRLWRSDVPEPPAHIDSEHDLDNYRTDILLLRDDMEGELQKAKEKFPQYVNYVATDITI